EGHLLRVHGEDALTPADVGARHRDPAIEAAGAQDGGVEDVRAVRRGDDDDALVRLEAVHLHEELIERLLSLVVATAEPGAAMPADRIDLVDEDDARGVLFAL